MTTIAWRAGPPPVMAADTQGIRSGMLSEVKKIARLKEGNRITLIGGAGNLVDIMAFVGWYPHRWDSQKPNFIQWGDKDMPEFEVIVCEHDGKAYLWDQYLQPRQILEPFWAIGTGAMAAMAAMHMGADPSTAVEIAIKCDTYSGGKIQVVRSYEEFLAT